MPTILLVDDDPHVRPMIRDILELGGHDVIEAGGAEEAFEVEAEHEGPIDLVLTDVMMPGLTGPEMARRLRPRRPEAKLLYMSAFTEVDFASQGIDLDAGVPVLSKPFGIDELTSKVEEVLATPAPPVAMPAAARP